MWYGKRWSITPLQVRFYGEHIDKVLANNEELTSVIVYKFLEFAKR